MSNPIANLVRCPNDGTAAAPSVSFGGSSITNSGTGVYGNEISMNLAVLGSSVAAISASGIAATIAYTPAAGGDWVNPDPTNLKDAVDRLAAAVAGLLVGPIP